MEENKEVVLRPDMPVKEVPKNIKPGPDAVDITPAKDGGIMKEVYRILHIIIKEVCPHFLFS